MRQEIHTKRRTFRRRKPPLWMRASILLLIVVVVGVPLFSLFAPAGTVQAAWYNSSWTYRIKLTVNAEHVAQDTATTTVFLASGSSWTVPQGWSSSNNTIECIGAGGDGGNGSGSATGSGGGGGAYAKISNLSLTPGASVAYVVGTGGSQNDTYFNGVASTSASLSCVQATL